MWFYDIDSIEFDARRNSQQVTGYVRRFILILIFCTPLSPPDLRLSGQHQTAGDK